MITRLFIRRSSLRFLPPVAAFFFSAIAGISVAAWFDAPNAPPNYGLTPPYTQGDFRPMNLGTSPQTKNGSMAIVGTIIATSTNPTYFPNFPGNVVASGFHDSEGTDYFLDPATMAGYSGVFSSSVGIRQKYPGASFVVNNDSTSPTREASGKIGSLNDAIYAYANSSNAALSAEQGNPAGYAVYATGGINYFQGNVGIGITNPQAPLTVMQTIAGLSTGLQFSGQHTPGITAGGIINSYDSDGTTVRPLTLQTNGGNVGIGTANPQAKLHVAGDIQVDGTITTSASTSFSKYLQIKSGAGIYYLPLYYSAPPGSGSFCRNPASGTYCGGRVYQGTPTLQSQSGTTAYYSTGQLGTGCQCGNQQGYQFDSQYNMETQTWISWCSFQVNFQQGC